jgi:hypothetical protein
MVASRAGPETAPGPTAALASIPLCQRLSSPAMRTFINIADQWQLSEDERLMVLGLPGRLVYLGWICTARTGQNLILPTNALLRLSAIFGIYKSLGILFGTGHDASEWLRNPHHAPTFGGKAPMDLIVSKNQDGAVLVRRYLDNFLCGPSDLNDQDFTSYSDDDI